MQLKEYQQKALDWLRRYCQLAVQFSAPDTAFYQITRDIYGDGVPYRRAPGLLDMPYVLMRYRGPRRRTTRRAANTSARLCSFRRSPALAPARRLLLNG